MDPEELPCSKRTRAASGIGDPVDIQFPETALDEFTSKRARKSKSVCLGVIPVVQVALVLIY